MTISLESGEKRTFGPGALVDVGERQLHEVWIGSGGCECAVGEQLVACRIWWMATGSCLYYAGPQLVKDLG